MSAPTLTHKNTPVTPVFIDLDGTLIDAPEAESMFFDYLTRRHMIKRKHFLAYAWFTLRHFSQYGLQVGRYNKAYVADMRRADVDVYAESFAKKVLLELVRPEMQRVVELHKRRGDTVILFAEAPDFILRALARRLQVPYWRGTIFQYLGNKYLNGPPAMLLAGDTKRAQANMMVEKLGANLKRSFYYASSIEDLPLLEAIGHPVAVFPDKKLLKKAQQAKWQIINQHLDPLDH